jgi:hypothetical protein
VRECRCHSKTLCRPLPYLLHVASLERGQWHPLKEYGHLPRTRMGRRRDVKPAERISSITSGPVWPSPPLCCHPENYRAIPNTVATQIDRTSPRPPLYSLRPSVSQALELAYGQRSNENFDATTLEAAPGRHRTRHDACQRQDSPGQLSIPRHRTPCWHTQHIRTMWHDCKLPPLVYKRRRRSPGRGGRWIANSPAFPPSPTIVALSLNQTSGT